MAAGATVAAAVAVATGAGVAGATVAAGAGVGELVIATAAGVGELAAGSASFLLHPAAVRMTTTKMLAYIHLFKASNSFICTLNKLTKESGNRF
ncbi:hypothetical protein D3C71_1914930 [compost metagenome]